MYDTDDTKWLMLLMKDAKGDTAYSGLWNKDDTNWKNFLISQVPLGIDPRTSADQGIFVMPMEEFAETSNGNTCI